MGKLTRAIPKNGDKMCGKPPGCAGNAGKLTDRGRRMRGKIPLTARVHIYARWIRWESEYRKHLYLIYGRNCNESAGKINNPRYTDRCVKIRVQIMQKKWKESPYNGEFAPKMNILDN